MDEPTNNMDYEGRQFFYNFIRNWNGGFFLISHDRELLNLMDKILELRNFQKGNTELFSYGGNFENYRKIKEIEENNLTKELNESTKNLEHQKNKQYPVCSALGLFIKTDTVLKNVNDLSGGEKIRFLLCCILAKKDIEMIILDEPTNNLYIDSIEILENILNNFNGAILVVSHDEIFKKNIKISNNIRL